MRSAMRIMKRRIMIVPISSGVFSCISICIFVNGTMCILNVPLYRASRRPSESTFSLARSDVYGNE